MRKRVYARVYSLVVLAVALVSIGAGIAMLARPSAPSPAPYPGVVFDGNQMSCAQVGYGQGETTFYRCKPLG